MEFKNPLKKRRNKKRSIKGKAKFSADSTSRSLSLASRDQLLSRELVCEIQANNRLILDITQIINDGKIQLSKKAAIKLARWILTQYERQDLLAEVLTHYKEQENARTSESQADNTQETNVVGESESDNRVPSSQTKAE